MAEVARSGDAQLGARVPDVGGALPQAGELVPNTRLWQLLTHAHNRDEASLLHTLTAFKHVSRTPSARDDPRVEALPAAAACAESANPARQGGARDARSSRAADAGRGGASAAADAPPAANPSGRRWAIGLGWRARFALARDHGRRRHRRRGEADAAADASAATPRQAAAAATRPETAELKSWRGQIASARPEDGCRGRGGGRRAAEGRTQRRGRSGRTFSSSASAAAIRPTRRRSRRRRYRRRRRRRWGRGEEVREGGPGRTVKYRGGGRDAPGDAASSRGGRRGGGGAGPAEVGAAAPPADVAAAAPRLSTTAPAPAGGERAGGAGQRRPPAQQQQTSAAKLRSGRDDASARARLPPSTGRRDAVFECVPATARGAAAAAEPARRRGMTRGPRMRPHNDGGALIARALAGGALRRRATRARFAEEDAGPRAGAAARRGAWRRRRRDGYQAQI